MNPKTQAAVEGCLVDAFTKATLCTGEELYQAKASKTLKTLFIFQFHYKLII